MKVMKSIVISLNQGYFGLHYMKKPFKNYEWLETFKVVFGPAIFACACCIPPKKITYISTVNSVLQSGTLFIFLIFWAGLFVFEFLPFFSK